MPRRLFYCDHHEFPLPPGHKFPIRKYKLLRGLLAEDGFYQLEPAPPGPADLISLAHDPGYVQGFLSGTLDAAQLRRIGFPWSEALVRRTLASVGGTLCAAGDAIGQEFGGNLAGGTHHAFRAEGAGFCVFNDIAVAILTLRKEGQARRAAVLDLDVHQGDGTAQLFENDREVLTVSLHAGSNFPFRKQKSKIDIDLADNTKDNAYLETLAGILPDVFEFRPEVIFYQSGVDGLAEDRLGRLSLTLDGLRRRDTLVCETAQSRGVPLVITLGGGYAEPIELTAEAHANTFRMAARVFGESSDSQK
jgi:acetoin utilization deacetylase AcuC-like enzyme